MAENRFGDLATAFPGDASLSSENPLEAGLPRRIGRGVELAGSVISKAATYALYFVFFLLALPAALVFCLFALVIARSVGIPLYSTKVTRL